MGLLDFSPVPPPLLPLRGVLLANLELWVGVVPPASLGEVGALGSRVWSASPLESGDDSKL